ncbi:MAG: ABC transporter permease [Sporichthyaceae bacterium]
MGRYVARRLLQMIFVVIGATFLIFAMVYALPGDPLAGKCGERKCPAEFIAAETERLHLSDPLPIQYLYYMGNLLTGDFGTTSSGEKVTDLIRDAYPATVKLAVIALIFIALAGIGSGILSGIRRGGAIDRGVLIFTLFLISLPVFVIGTLGQWILGHRLDIFPVTATDGTWGQLIMPGLVVAALSLAYVSRITRSSLSENLRADYVRTARAKGMPERRVIGIHALRNSMIPVVTSLGSDFGTLLGGAVVTEGIFGIRGIGGLVYDSIRQREGATVVGVVTVLVLIFLLVNLFVDLLYAVLDPRIRYE